LIAETTVEARVGEQLSVEDVSRRYRLAAERKGRKRSTLQDLESHARVHLVPFFGDRAIASILPVDVEDFVFALEDAGKSPKTIRNIVGTLSALFNFAKQPRNRWATMNPCDGIDLPADTGDVEIRFLTLEQVETLLAHARPGSFQTLDRAIWLTAAMTGLRQGELLALRWVDVDWAAARLRVRQNYVRGEFGTPKSRRSVRSVPMADEVAGELDRLFKASRWQQDEDLVFAHPGTGLALPKANVGRRFKKALRAAGLPDRRFHDLRHTFGTMVAASGRVPMRTLQEWMGHRDLKTTLIYADYSASHDEAATVASIFARGSNPGSNLSESGHAERP
jgi:integrase